MFPNPFSSSFVLISASFPCGGPKWDKSQIFAPLFPRSGPFFRASFRHCSQTGRLFLSPCALIVAKGLFNERFGNYWKTGWRFPYYEASLPFYTRQCEMSSFQLFIPQHFPRKDSEEISLPFHSPTCPPHSQTHKHFQTGLNWTMCLNTRVQRVRETYWHLSIQG